jgi:drug/metabolite transporter (DMT)-like permease
MWTPERRAAAALTGAALLWSGNFIAGRALRGDVDAITLNLLRWTICLVVFLPWVARPLWQHRHVVHREWRLLLGLGLTGIAAFHTMVYLALATTTAINALLMLSMAPATILLASAAAQRRAGARLWLGTGVSLAGAGVLITRGDLRALTHLARSEGDLWMLAAIAVWTVYSLLLRRRPADLPQQVTLAASIVPALLVLAFAAAVTRPAWPPPATVKFIGSLIYIALGASLLAFLLWSYGLSVVGAQRGGQFIHLMPVFGSLLAVVLLGESVTIAQGLGAALVLAGLVIGQARVKLGTAASPARPTSP